jgi:hypothetical protein
MISVVFSIVVIIHGLIHLMGFVKAYRLADVPQLAHDISKPAGALWLCAALLFFASACVLSLGMEWWWMVALGAMLVSQTLIIASWQDGKFGSLVNAIIFAGVVIGFGSWQFNSASHEELSSFLDGRPVSQETLSMDMIAHVPPVVQRWLIRTQSVGKAKIHTVHLVQQGTMRTAPDGSWMPVTADQWFTVERPGLFWLADVKAAPGIHLAGRDKYEAGRGHMLIKALSLLPVADAKGREIDQGTMLRYMAEIAWFPSAAVSDYIAWKQIDSNSAQATMTYGGVTASGMFTFTPEGDMSSFEARRYYDRKTGPTLETWHIQIDPAGFREFEGIRIGARSSVTWKLKDGDFTWFTMEVTSIDYNSRAQHTTGLQ